MFGRKRLIKIGLLVGVIGLLVLFPARVAYQWFAPQQIVVSGISGTVWNGHASEATIDGIYLHDVSWQYRLSDLLTARLGYSVNAKFVSGFIEGNIAVGFGGNLRAREFRANLPLESIQTLAAMTGARGMLSANFAELQLSGGLPSVADGSIEVSGLTLPMVHREPIGGFKAELFTQDSGISASIEDTAAVIDMAGSLQLSAGGKYEFLAQLGPLDSTPAPIREQLQFLGSPNDRGQHELRLEGQL